MEGEDLLSRISEVHPNQVWLDKEKVEKRYIYLFFKRMIDIVGSIIGLILASPLMFYVAYRIRKEEPGSPIFFSIHVLVKMEKHSKCINSVLCV